MNKMELLETLNQEELEFYKKLIAFFKIFGISEELLLDLVSLGKQANDLIDNINRFSDAIPNLQNRVTALEQGKILIGSKSELEELNTPVGSMF